MPGKTHESRIVANGAASNASDAVEASKNSRSSEWMLIHCLGFGTCWGWVHVAFFSTMLFGVMPESLSLSSWILNVLSNGIAMVALGLFSLWCSPRTFRRLGPLFAALTVLGTIGFSFGASLSVAWVYVAAVLSGFGTAGLLLLWAEAYRDIPPALAKQRTIPASLAVGVLYYLLICMLSHLVGVIVTMLLPVISVAFFHLSSRMNHGGEIGEAERAIRAIGHGEYEVCDEAVTPKKGRLSAIRGAVPVRFAIFIGIYCLAPGFMRSYTSALPFASAGGIGEAMFSGVAVVLVVLAVASIVLFGEAKIDLAYKFVVPLMAAGLLLLPFMSAGQEALAAVVIMSGYTLLEIYVWASLADSAANTSAPTPLVFGLGKSCMNVGLLAGTFLGMYFGSSSSMLLVGVMVFIVYLFIVMENAMSPGIGVALSLDHQDDRKPGKRAAKPNKVTIEEAAKLNLSEMFNAMLDERCSIVASRYGLSARETEVLGQLARGRSLQAIADDLCVAYSTIKTHTDRIYAKTGVHSRQDLISLLENSGG